MSPAWIAAVLAALAAGLWIPRPRAAPALVGLAGADPMAAFRRSGPVAGMPRRGVVAVLLLLALLPVAGPRVVVLGVVAVGGLLGVGWLIRLRRASARAAAVDDRVCESCEGLADDLAAGASAERALARSAAEWPTLEPVLAAHRLGLDVPDAWRALALDHGAGGLRVVAAAWQVSGRTGQGLAVALRRVAADMRAARASRRVVDSELASARATGRLVAMLPLAAWLMGSGAGEGGHPVTWLLAGPAGWACLVVGGGLLLLGLGWIELLARQAAGP